MDALIGRVVCIGGLVSWFKNTFFLTKTDRNLLVDNRSWLVGLKISFL